MNPAVIGTLIPIVIFMIPIVAILTKHQQRMAEIIHSRSAGNDDLVAMRQELYDLRNLVNQQSLAIDNLSNTIRSLPIATAAERVQTIER